MGKDFKECQLEMAQANFAAKDFGVSVRDAVKTKTNVRLEITCENVAGCQQPTFHVRGLEDADDLMIGMTGGGQAIAKAKERFSRYLKLLVEIASLQTQFITIERVIKVTNRRVNALEFVIIPHFETTIKWIEGELDELDREDFYRLKCVQDKKVEQKDEEAAELAQKMAMQALAEGDQQDQNDENKNQDILHVEPTYEQEDEDIIF